MFLGLGDCGVDYVNDTVEQMHPMLLQMKDNAEDNPTWEEAHGPNQAGYWKAMDKELNTLEHDKDSWEEVDRAPWMNVLPSTWAFCCKRFPDGLVR
jgi:hypothetical protein